MGSHDVTKTVLEHLSDEKPAEYLMWLTLWVGLVVFTVRTVFVDMFGKPKVSDAELRRLRTVDRVVSQMAKEKSDAL